eukprot:gene4152-20334_t
MDSEYTFSAIIGNYQVLLQVWKESLDTLKDREQIICIKGVQSQMDRFSFLFGVMLSQKKMKHSHNLRKTLKKGDISAADGQAVARMAAKKFESIRTEEGFYIFWRLVMKAKSQFDISNHVFRGPEKDLFVMKKAMQSLAQSEPCPIRVLPHQSLAPSEPCPIRALPHQSLAPLEPCPIRALPHQSLAPSEPCPIRALPHQSLAPPEPCPTRALPHQSLAPPEPCPIRALPHQSLAPPEPCPIRALPHQSLAPPEPCPTRALPHQSLAQSEPCPIRALPHQSLAPSEPCPTRALPH